MIDIGPIHRKEYEFGRDRSTPICVGEAPGRIHYLGEHSEQGAGLFLSSAINRYVRVAVSPRNDSALRFFAADAGEHKRTSIPNLRYRREDRWANHMKAAVQVFVNLGFPVKGLNFTMMRDIPKNAGLGSTEAVEMAALFALKALFRAPTKNRLLVANLLEVKKEYYGKNYSPVDYLISIEARKDQFLVIDEGAGEIRKIKSPLTKYSLLVTNSKVPRFGIEDDMHERQEEVAKAKRRLAITRPGATLRSLVNADLREALAGIPEEARRMTTHVIREYKRISGAEEALKAGDIPALAKIFAHSQESLRDLYEVSCPEIDWLVKRTQEMEGVAGSRMTGRGFGGCTFTFITEEAIPQYQKRLEEYERIFGFQPIVYEMKMVPGVHLAE
ncbi:MAG: galactokinase [Treponema sp.]|jgi:galactokinase|nr:galactokinase [Treponema sp.]